jgi:hypothetical protein
MDLIICPGHGINVDPSRPAVPESWVGIYPEEANLLLQHCSAAVAMAGANPQSRLAFTGGDTREAAGPITEAESYSTIASTAKWWGATDVLARTLIERYARCSRDNLVYSLACFFAAERTFPARIVVVGWEFKRERFLMHCKAIHWPGEFRYVGINNPLDGGPLVMALAGEACKREAMRKDPLLLGPEWASQRRIRNPFNTKQPYSEQVPEMAAFVDYLNGTGGPAPPPWAKDGIS